MATAWGHAAKQESSVLLRRHNQRSWLYRIRPSVTHEPFHPLDFPQETLTANFSQVGAAVITSWLINDCLHAVDGTTAAFV